MTQMITEQSGRLVAYVVRRVSDSVIYGSGTTVEAARIAAAQAASVWAPVKSLLEMSYAPLRFPDAIVDDESQQAEFWVEPIDLSAGLC